MTLATEYEPAGSHQHSPYEHFKRMRDEEPVSLDSKTGIHLVTRYDTVKHVVETPEKYSSQGANPLYPENQPEPIGSILRDMDRVGTSVLETDGETHRAHRAIWNNYLHGKVIAGFQEGLRRRAREHAGVLSGTADLASEFIEPYVVSCVGGELMGLPDDEHRVAQGHAMDIVTWSTPWLPMEDRIAAARRTASAMDSTNPENNWFRHWYEKLRREQMRPNLLSMAAHLSSFDQFIVFAIVWIPAVHTTVGGLLNAIYHALRLGLWRDMARNSELIPLVWEESLRIDAPHRGLARTVTEDTTLEGAELAKGDMLLLLFGAANRDERKFSNPDEFNPHRDNVRDHFAFGYGPHVCAGKHLATTEARTALSELATTFPDMRLRDDFEPSYVADLFFRMPSSLPVELK